MDRCPNCGSSVRAGAKFCTTCGFRLPIQPLAPAQPTSARSPFDLTSSAPASSRWPNPADSPAAPVAPVEPAAPAEQALDQEPPAEAIPDPPAVDAIEPPDRAAATFTGWPQFGSSIGSPTSWEASKPEEPPVDLGTPERVEEAISQWTNGSALSSETEDLYRVYEPAEANTETEDAIESPSESVRNDDSHPTEVTASEPVQLLENQAPVAERDTEIDAAKGSADLNLPTEDTHSDDAADAAVPFILPVVDISLDADDALNDEVIPMPVAPSQEAIAEAPPTPGALSAKDRAIQLVDELRKLLPEMSADTGGGNDTQRAAIDVLTASKTVSETEAESFKSLRAAVATAQARPRDVDVMLDLVARAATIAAVIAAHDRYASAIDNALSILREEAPEQPEPRW